MAMVILEDDRVPRTRETIEARNSGFALVGVLAFLLVISALVVPFAVTARTRLMIANNEIEHEKLSLLAAGLVNVLSTAVVGGAAPKLRLDFFPMQCRAGNLLVQAQIQDHNGLIDLNAAEPALLALGFTAVGLAPVDASKTAQSVVAYRNSANAFSAADISSDQTAVRGDLKRAPFESVAELNDIVRLRGVPISRLYGVFTVNSKSGTTSILHAPEPIRNAIRASVNVATIVAEKSDTRAYTVGVVVQRAPSGMVGDAGYVVERVARKGYRLVARTPPPMFDLAGKPMSSLGGCDELFGVETAQALREWANG
jgi:general secretion pathway protein K